MIDSGFIFQNSHRRVAVLDVPMLEKGPMSDVHIGRTLVVTDTLIKHMAGAAGSCARRSRRRRRMLALLAPMG